MIRADLHIHTYYSDGLQSPADVVATAKRNGVGLISVTDHDNMNATAEVEELAKNEGVACVDGIEVSAYDGNLKVHMLGYGIDFRNPVMAKFLMEIKDGGDERTYDILKKLSAVGVDISYEEVARERKCENSPIHSMYIAQAGARKGYAKSRLAFFSKYLNYGKAGFSCVARPSPENTAAVISECGGVCSLAHPGRIAIDEAGVISLIERLIPCGLSGIEGVYSGHTAIQTQYYKGVAEKYGLLVTGGSDTHIMGGNRRVGDPLFYPSDGLLSALKIK